MVRHVIESSSQFLTMDSTAMNRSCTRRCCGDVQLVNSSKYFGYFVLFDHCLDAQKTNKRFFFVGALVFSLSLICWFPSRFPSRHHFSHRIHSMHIATWFRFASHVLACKRHGHGHLVGLSLYVMIMCLHICGVHIPTLWSNTGFLIAFVFMYPLRCFCVHCRNATVLHLDAVDSTLLSNEQAMSLAIDRSHHRTIQWTTRAGRRHVRTSRSSYC